MNFGVILIGIGSRVMQDNRVTVPDFRLSTCILTSQMSESVFMNLQIFAANLVRV